MGDNKNFILFAVISLGIMLGYNFLYAGPRQAEYQRQQQQQQFEQQEAARLSAEATPQAPQTLGQGQTPTPQASEENITSAETLAMADAGFVRIETPELSGSISLRGARFDDLTLVKHKADNPDKTASDKNVQLLKKYGSDDAYYASFNWAATRGAKASVPDASTAWAADKNLLTPDSPVTLSWVNPAGAKFLMRIEVDENFMFTVTQTVINVTDQALTIAPSAELRRFGTPKTSKLLILHEGPIGMFDGILEESLNYDDLKEDGNFVGKPDKSEVLTGGWMGITDKFWMATLIPNNKDVIQRARLTYAKERGIDTYGADYAQAWQTVPAGATVETTNRFYAGAKIVNIIDDYETTLKIKDFGKAIDWGYLWFFTRPIFVGLHWLFGVTGNYGVAILLMTVILKLGLFPLASKSYVSMQHMKTAQPKIKALQERYKDDKQKLQQETMALYKSEKINPMAGCLPMIPQMFIFFALYKTLYVTIEMRHQPFFGWIKDMSAADPLTPVNLFGLIPWDPPSMIAIGVLPILMGISMWLQQRLNPQTSMDPMQQKIMGMLPILFTFIMAQFSAGLVLYWTWNNILSIAQQSYIMKREKARMEARGGV